MGGEKGAGGLCSADCSDGLPPQAVPAHQLCKQGKQFARSYQPHACRGWGWGSGKDPVGLYRCLKRRLRMDHPQHHGTTCTNKMKVSLRCRKHVLGGGVRRYAQQHAAKFKPYQCSLIRHKYVIRVVPLTQVQSGVPVSCCKRSPASCAPTLLLRCPRNTINGLVCLQDTHQACLSLTCHTCRFCKSAMQLLVCIRESYCRKLLTSCAHSTPTAPQPHAHARLQWMHSGTSALVVWTRTGRHASRVASPPECLSSRGIQVRG